MTQIIEAVPTKTFEKIVNKLPIGYYLGKSIPVICDYESDTSYFSPNDYQIHIAYNNVATMYPSIADSGETDPEFIIRVLVYHELSHVILTPDGMSMGDVNNIFEDERIETILSDYYLGVNFKKLLTSVYDMNTDVSKLPAMTKFFFAVRLRLTTDEINNDIDTMIKKYSALNSSSHRWYKYNGVTVYNYEDAIKDLYRKITGEEPPVGRQNSNNNSKGNSNGKAHDSDDMNSASENGKSGNSEQEQQNSNSKNGVSDHSQQAGNGCSMDRAKILAGVEKGIGTFIKDKEEIKGVLEGILLSFNKRTNNGMAVQKYSGRLNPKLLQRDDYKIFERIASGNGNNKYGTFHLNLFQDNSGSYEQNRTKTNALIQALTELEDKYSFFTCTVFHCACGQVERKRNDRFIDCSGGTQLTKEIEQQFKQAQQQNTYNYNIVLYDGDASPEKLKNGKNAFSVFDKSNVTMILDSDNAKYVRGIKGAKVVISSGNYADELYENVSKAFTRAMR